MKQYLDLMRHVREHGTFRATAPAPAPIACSATRCASTRRRLPAGDHQKCHLKSIIHELLWFLQGDTNIKYLKENGVRIWDEWADEDGELGPVYGYQWRSAGAERRVHRPDCQPAGDDQEESGFAPADRLGRNPALVEQMALPPCHALFQFYVADGKLSCQLYQRSADIFLGVPFNIASYALLTLMVAQVCDLEPGEFIWSGGDCHLYANHGAGRSAADPRAAAAADHEAQSRGEGPVRLPLRGLRAGRLRGTRIKAPVAV